MRFLAHALLFLDLTHVPAESGWSLFCLRWQQIAEDPKTSHFWILQLLHWPGQKRSAKDDFFVIFNLTNSGDKERSTSQNISFALSLSLSSPRFWSIALDNSVSFISSGTSSPVALHSISKISVLKLIPPIRFRAVMIGATSSLSLVAFGSTL